MDTNTARAILSEAAAGDYFDGDLPEEESELLALAKYYVEEAQNYISEGNPPDQHIDAIINLSKVSAPVLSAVAVHNHDGTPPEQIDSVTKTPITQEYEDKVTKEALVRETYPRRSSGGYSESDMRDFEGFPVPKAIPETSLDMPMDLSEVPDKAARTLYSGFTSYYNRARWKLAVAQSSLTNATHLRDAEYRKAYKKHSMELIQSGERATKDLVDSFARDDEEYKLWEDKVVQHEQEVIHWKALFEIYGKNVEVISRDWTMRTEQYERER